MAPLFRPLLTCVSICFSHVSQACTFDFGSSLPKIPARNITETVLQNLNARVAHNENVPPPTKTIIEDVRMFDGETLTGPTTVVISGERIGSLDTFQDAPKIINGTGHVLMPGFIDSHCHPDNITDLQALARYGVTTTTIMACTNPELCASLRNHVGLTDVIPGSCPAAAVDSIHGQLLGLNSSTAIMNASHADAWVDQQIHNGASFIKLIAETPGLDQATLNAATEASQRRDRLVICHAADYKSVEQALVAKVNHVHHVPLDKPLDANLSSVYLRQGAISVPTLIMMKQTAAAIPKLRFNASSASVTRLLQYGIPILVGTDANSQPHTPARPTFGLSLHEEMELLNQAGMSPIDILRAGTSVPARIWGLHDRGTIEIGKRADLVLVQGDPTKNISATRNIRNVWIAGHSVV